MDATETGSSGATGIRGLVLPKRQDSLFADRLAEHAGDIPRLVFVG
jgi:hypothetical protein